MSALATDVQSLTAAADLAAALYEPWPIDEQRFVGFGRAASLAYAAAASSLSGPSQDLFLSEIRILDFLIQTAHASAVTRASQERGLELRIGPMAKAFYAPDWSAFGRAHAATLVAGADARLSGLRQVRRIIRGNPHLGLLRRVTASLRRPQAWAVGSPGALLREWARRRNIAMAWPEIGKLQAAPDTAALAEAATAVRRCVEAMDRLARDHMGGALDQGPVTSAWNARLETLARVAAGVHATRVPAVVFVAGAGNSLHRAVALSARRAGARVLTAQHGHNAGHLDADIICFNDYAISDGFVCETRLAAIVAQRRSEMMVLPPGRKLQFEWLPEPSNADRWQARKPRGTGSNSIMLMGFPHSARRSHADIGYHFHMRLDLELRIAAQLRADGYRVLYKAHPEFANTTRPLVAPFVDEFIGEPFGAVATRADLIVFTYPLTTALAEATLTEIPIVMFDFAGQAWSPHERNLLERRMAMMPARVESGSRLAFEPADLRSAIARAPTLRSDDYVQLFMLPEPSGTAPVAVAAT